MEQARRDFLRQCACALGTAAFASSYRKFGLINALAQSKQMPAPDYKALVCIFLFGGNDGNNMVIPYDGYSSYAAVRAPNGPITIPQGSLNPFVVPSHGSNQFSLHPNMPELRTLFTQQKLAVLCNTGTLVAPMTRAQYLNGSVPRPDNLFSHDDQAAQNQTSVSAHTTQFLPTGWGGRLADNTGDLNGTNTFPMIVSLAGSSVFTTGVSTRPLVPNSGLSGFPNPPTSDPRYNAMQYLMTVDTGHTLVAAQSDNMQRAIVNTNLLNQALANGGAVTTVFPNTGIGNQLRQVARIIAARSQVGLQRQVFFCSQGGYDTHDGQLAAHATLFSQLSAAMSAFYNATVVDLQIPSQITTFSLSDFGRTFQPNLDGTDHAWGNQQLIMGGSVRGGDFYGTYPTLALGTGDDSGNEGRWIPKTAVDQFGATLAKWYGLDPLQQAVVFPNIGQFSPQDLGFML